MARYTTDYVNLIVNNLRDRYKSGFPILKELIQNADDAGAKNLIFGYHSGFKNATNQLLTSPALWLINDGRFLADDKAAINSFGLNSKAAEKGAIGKFGLGMKSVFHLCEAFFYIGYDGETEHIEVLSPWFQEGLSKKHATWEQFPQDSDALLLKDIAHNQAENLNTNSWFLLWIPLRQKNHVAQDSAPIIDAYPGDDTSQHIGLFEQENIEQQIAALLPLLRHVETVKFLGSENQSDFEVDLVIDDNHHRLDHISPELFMKGQVKYKSKTHEPLFFLAQQKALEEDYFFTELKQLTAWPKTNAIQNNKHISVPDKAEAEGAILFAHQNKKIGSLSIQWAVFLPAEEHYLSYEVAIPNSSREYRIVLHGQFFIDAGRRGIEGANQFKRPLGSMNLDNDATESEIHIAWNKGIAQQLVLPLFLPALAQYISQYKLKDNDITALIGALKSCKNNNGSFLIDFENFICAEYSYVRRLTNKGGQWDLVKGNQIRFLTIPEPRNNDHNRPWMALPGLNDLECLFVDKEAPSLIGLKISTLWSEGDLQKVINSIGVESLTSQIYLAYIVEFLSAHSGVLLNYSSIQSALINRLQSLLQHCSLTDIRQNRSAFIDLITLLPEDRIYGLGTKEVTSQQAIPEGLYKKLLQAPAYVLLLPNDLTPEGYTSTIDKDEASAWLKIIGLELQQQNTPAVSHIELTKSIFDRLKDKEAIILLLEKHSDLPLLIAYSVKNKIDIACSLKELRLAHRKNLLFSRTAPNEKSFLGGLVEVVEDLNPLSIIKDIREYTNLKTKSPSDSNAIFSAIGAQDSPPILRSESIRSKFLSLAISALEANDHQAIRGARYLLHGNSDKFFDTDSVLWSSGQSSELEWEKLWQMVEPNTWAVLKSKLVEQIPVAKFEILTIRSINTKSVIDLLKNKPDQIKFIESTRFTLDEKERILNQVRNDEELWTGLPFHKDSHGIDGPIDENCFLGTEPALPQDIADTVRLIIPSQDKNFHHDQSSFISPWSSSEATKVVLEKHTAPSLHYDFLLKHLPVKNTNSLDLWLDTPWLKLSNDSPIAPKNIIFLSGAESDIQHLIDKGISSYSLSSQLHESIKNHSKYQLLCDTLFSEKQSLHNIADLMLLANYHLGENIQVNTGEVDNLSVLSGLSSLPGWRIINNLTSTVDREALTKEVIPRLRKQLGTEQIEEVLSELSLSNSSSSKSLFIDFVKEWVNSASIKILQSRLYNLRLLAKDKSWQPATKLVAGVSGVSSNCELDPELVSILSNLIDTNQSVERVETDEASQELTEFEKNYDLSATLHEWIKDFASTSIKQALGAVVGMFGKKASDLADNLLKPVAYADYLNQLNWSHPGYEEVSGRRQLKWMTSSIGTLEQAMSYFSMYLEVLESDLIEVNTILGDETTLKIQPMSQIGSLYIKDRGSSKQFIVVMRPLSDLGYFEPSEQKRILQRTAEDLFKAVYKQDNVNLTSLWGSFEKSNQIELAIAKALILNGLPSVLESFPTAKKQDDISLALREYSKAERDIASAEAYGSSPEKAEKNLKATAKKLSNLLENNVEVQTAIFTAIKKRVEDNQYELSSIPFEILQNADDAVGEFQLIQQTKNRPVFSQKEIGRFAVLTTGNSIVLIHWGRPINFCEHDDSDFEHYDRDIERMLMLGASGKDDANITTGKFGLGFKSTFLACDSPIVFSGDLRFKIVAGCLPVLADISSEAKELLTRAQGATKLQATVIELPVAEHTKNELMARFRRLASLCTVFTRHIKHIELPERSSEWAPNFLMKINNTLQCYIGKVDIPNKKGFIARDLLVFESNLGHMALILGENGIALRISSMKKHRIPAIWVNAPTRGMDAGGILLNAGFAIDTGRGSLPQGKAADKNKNLANQLASQIAPLIIQLVNATCQDWPIWSQELKLAKSISLNQFWYGFWSVVKAHEIDEEETDISQDSALLSEFSKTLFKQVVTATEVVPSGLKIAAHQELIDIKQIRLSIKQDRHKFIDLLSNWELFISKNSIHKWVSNEVYEWLTDVNMDGVSSLVQDLDEEILMSTLGREKRLQLKDLPYLGSLIQDWPQYQQEEKKWSDQLKGIKLRAKDGSWKHPEEIVNVDDINNYNNILYKLAPEKLFLDSQYHSAQGWNVLADYLRFKIPSHYEQAQWCLDAETTSQQKAVLQALAKSLDNQAVWEGILSYKIYGNWLFDLKADDSLFKGCCSQQEIQSLLLKLNFTPEEEAVGDDYYYIPSLPTIAKWWKVHRNEYLKKYQKNFWPDEVDIQGLAFDDKEAWMTLFSLAIFTRMGRVIDSQHKGFISFLIEKSWWETVAFDNPQDNESEWMAILQEYAEGSSLSTEFEGWIDSFPRLYRIARWFDEYVELFKGVDYRSAGQLTNLLTPEADPSLSGSGLNMPSVAKTLSLGHNLVIRELLRADVLSSDVAKSLAYMPRQRVKNLLEELGCLEVRNSQDIYNFLQDKIIDSEAKNFYGDYDIPLLIISKDKLLQEIAQWAEQLDEWDYDA